MQHYTDDNTDGYTPEQLDALNAELDALLTATCEMLRPDRFCAVGWRGKARCPNEGNSLCCVSSKNRWHRLQNPRYTCIES